MAIADFIDDGVCRKFYADEALQIRSACKSLAITYEPSIPGRHETNAKIENTILDVERGTRSALIQAGFPPCFWSFAAPTYCLLDNTEYLDPLGVPYTDGSRWARFHGAEFEGLRAPFGCEVIFKQSTTKAADFQPTKWEGTGTPWHPCGLSYVARLSLEWGLPCVVSRRTARSRFVSRR